MEISHMWREKMERSRRLGLIMALASVGNIRIRHQNPRLVHSRALHPWTDERKCTFVADSATIMDRSVRGHGHQSRRYPTTTHTLLPTGSDGSASLEGGSCCCWHVVWPSLAEVFVTVGLRNSSCRWWWSRCWRRFSRCCWRRRATHGRRQQRMTARMVPRRVHSRPLPMSTYRYCDASAPGFSCTKPTNRVTAPASIVTTATCSSEI